MQHHPGSGAACRVEQLGDECGHVAACFPRHGLLHLVQAQEGCSHRAGALQENAPMAVVTQLRAGRGWVTGGVAGCGHSYAAVEREGGG